MSNGPHLQEFEYLQVVYRRTCEAFDRGEISSVEARDTITRLRHTDADGVAWKIDTTRSGRRAAVVRVSDQPAPPTVRRIVPTGLDTLDEKYREICEAFDRGEMTSAAARNEVVALRYTDAQGYTWKIDTQRSGRRAAFVRHHEAPKPEPIRVVEPVRIAEPVPEEALTTDQIPVVSADNDVYDDGSRVLRIKKIAVLATTAVASIALLVTFTGGSDTATTISTSSVAGSTPLSPIPTIPNDNDTDNEEVVTPLLSSFATREAIPNDTEIEFGRSVQNRPLTFIRRGNPNGVRVLAVGCIHGNECAGLAVTDILKSMEAPSNIDLWILPKLNPDGTELKIRQNANKVDLNRNFPVRWKPLGKSGFWQWSGTGAASEPETKSMIPLGKMIQPQLSIWYHQDYFRISPGVGRDGDIRERYAILVDLPILKIEGGTYSGTSSMWSETLNDNDTTSLTVEFGKGLREGEAQANVDAIKTVVKEFYSS